MDFLDRIKNELTEASTNRSSKGNFRILSRSNQNDGGESGGKPGGKPGGQQGGKPGGQQGGQQGGKPGGKPGGQQGGKPGKGSKPGKGGKPDKARVEMRNGELFINGQSSGSLIRDDHSGLNPGSVQDFDDIIRQTYDEVMERGGDNSKSTGEGKGNTLSRVAEYLKPKFNIKPILKRLDDFKRLVGKQIVESTYESYAAAQHNPASQTGEMMRPSDIPGGSKLDVIKESAILIFSVDTSGSITQEDFKFIFGFLKKIEQHFAKPMIMRNDNGEKIGSLSGEVFLLEWDSGVHLPLRKWTQVQRGKVVKHVNKKKEEDAAERKLRGGGGTNINLMFKMLDKLFYRKVGKHEYLDIDETADYITSERDIDKIDSKEVHNIDDYKVKENNRKPKHFKMKLKKQKRKKMSNISQDRIDQDVNLTPGEPNFLEGKKQVANVPFLLIYTDGYFQTANYTVSKLYADNPGNILYILTDKDGLSNLRPVNVMFHDIHGQGDNNLKRFSKKVE